MTDAMKAIREKQARGDWDLRPEQLRMLLLVERTVIETAPREVLQARLDERLRDKAFRTRNSAEGWPGSVSNRWLQQEIDTLQTALASGVTATAPADWKNEAALVLAQFIHLSVTPDRDEWARNASRAIRLLNDPAGAVTIHETISPLDGAEKRNDPDGVMASDDAQPKGGA